MYENIKNKILDNLEIVTELVGKDYCTGYREGLKTFVKKIEEEKLYVYILQSWDCDETMIEGIYRNDDVAKDALVDFANKNYNIWVYSDKKQKSFIINKEGFESVGYFKHELK